MSPCSSKGTPASASQMAKDVSTFLRWSSGLCYVVKLPILGSFVSNECLTIQPCNGYLCLSWYVQDHVLCSHTIKGILCAYACVCICVCTCMCVRMHTTTFVCTC